MFSIMADLLEAGVGEGTPLSSPERRKRVACVQSSAGQVNNLVIIFSWGGSDFNERSLERTCSTLMRRLVYESGGGRREGDSWSDDLVVRGGSEVDCGLWWIVARCVHALQYQSSLTV